MDMGCRCKQRERSISAVSVTEALRQKAIFEFNSHLLPVAPRIQPAGITLALLGERVELKCVVKAKPPPQVIFWRDHEGKEPVPLGANYEMTTDVNSDVSSRLPMKLGDRHTMIYFSFFITRSGCYPNDYVIDHSTIDHRICRRLLLSRGEQIGIANKGRVGSHPEHTGRT